MRDRKAKCKKEKRMEIGPVVPLWLTWVAAGAAGVLAIAAVAHMLEAVFDLDPS
jgi:hypothetical protein